jgi:hypothetical protein
VKSELNLPWKVVTNHTGKIAIVDCTNDGVSTTSGRVLNLAQGKDSKGLRIAQHICNVVNAFHGEVT